MAEYGQSNAIVTIISTFIFIRDHFLLSGDMKRVILMLLIVVPAGITYAQNESSDSALNYGYVELGGRYLAGLGVNYERQLAISPVFSFTLGAGVGTSYSIDSRSDSWPLIVPLSAGMLIGKKRSTLELGFSRLLVKKEFYTDPEDGQEWILPTAFNIGFRKLPDASRPFFYKLDFLMYPAYFIGVLPFLGAGIGYAF